MLTLSTLGSWFLVLGEEGLFTPGPEVAAPAEASLSCLMAGISLSDLKEIFLINLKSYNTTANLFIRHYVPGIVLSTFYTLPHLFSRATL